MPALSLELSALLEDVDTAPDGQPLDDALDALLDFVQTQRGPLIAGLAAVQTPPPPAPEPALVVTGLAPDHSLLRAYMRLVEEAEQVTYVPSAVDRRGLAYIPLPVPAHMTEAAFQELLEEEARMTEEVGRAEMAATLRTDLKRRQMALDSQARRDAQIAALGPPLAGRRTASAVMRH
jgi:hypothetical protein